MDPEDGHRWVIDTDERMIPGFAVHGAACLQPVITDLRSTGQAPPKATP